MDLKIYKKYFYFSLLVSVVVFFFFSFFEMFDFSVFAEQKKNKHLTIHGLPYDFVEKFYNSHPKVAKKDFSVSLQPLHFGRRFVFSKKFEYNTNFYTVFFEKYNYDRHLYPYLKYINYIFFKNYYFSIYNSYLSLKRSFDINYFYISYFFYKYFFLIESFNMGELKYSYLDNLKKINKLGSRDYNMFYLYNYSLNFFYFGNEYSQNKTELFLYSNSLKSVYGNLLYFYVKNNNYALSYYFFFTGYFFSIFIFYIFLFLIFFYYIVSYIIFYKKLYIMGQFFSLYNFDSEDQHGGHLDFMEEYELDLNLSDTYYNIVKYEFNYLNYLIYSNKFLFYWCNTQFFNSLQLGQTKLNRFFFFNEIYTKIELSFLSNITVDDDFAEWSAIAYEHVVQAFPESNFYLSDAVFKYAEVDLAFDFRNNQNKNYKEFFHPLNLFLEDPDPELEYDENFEDIFGFLKEYKNNKFILTTYKLRYKNIYKLLKNNIYIIENSVNYSGSLCSFYENYNRNFFVDFEGLNIDWPYLREISNGFKISERIRRFGDAENIEDTSDLAEFDYDLVEHEREKSREYKLENEDLGLVYKNNYYFFDGIFNLESLKERSDSELYSDYASYFSRSYSSFVKIKKDIFKLYSSSNFYSVALESALLQYFIRINFLWRNLSVPLEHDLFVDDANLYINDYRFKNLFDALYKSINFSENIDLSMFVKKKEFINLKVFNSLFNIFVNLENINSIKSTYPPYKNYIGYLLFNPLIRRIRDSYLFKNKKVQEYLFHYIHRNNKEILSFNFSVYNTYIFDNLGLPSGMVLSTNSWVSDDLYKNSNINQEIQLEEEEEYLVDNVFTKYYIYSIFRYVFLNNVLPVIFMGTYSYLIYVNIF